jgi:hypothetical protein
MGIEDLLDNLVRELDLPGEEFAEGLVAGWFDTGQAVSGLPTPAPPVPVQAVEAAGPPDSAVYTRTAQLQTLWLVITGAKAQYEEAEASGDGPTQAKLLKALGILMAVSEEETDAVNAVLKAQTN